MDSQSLRLSSYPNNVEKGSCGTEKIMMPSQIQDLSLCPAVEVINAMKTYQTNCPILNNLNMKVPQGSIYGLLGASGCGKTTMLSCIVGINKLDSGDVFVFGQRPRSAGSGIPGRRLSYMPQDISLYPLLTIKEMLEFFGKLYGMSDSEIGSRIEILAHFLDLPSTSMRIENLSGGQQRRTSLAASLLHEPPLLILDEPTVGVDPLLRQSIWNHLLELVTRRKTTIIITTHYIEEAKNSHTVGIMRSGRLLVEKSPRALLEEFNVTRLEDIVLRLCKADEESGPLNNNDTSAYSPHNKSRGDYSQLNDNNGVTGIKFKQIAFGGDNQKRSAEIRSTCAQNFPTSSTTNYLWTKYRRISALTTRNFFFLYRNPLLLFMMLGLPIIDLGITNVSLGPLPKNIKIGVVNPESKNFTSCSGPYERRCDFERISCRVLAEMSKEILTLVPQNSVDEALINVKNGSLFGYMAFPKEYSNHSVDRIVNGLFADGETLQGSTIEFRLDMSSYIAGFLVQQSIYESFQKYARNMLSDCGQDPRKADLPLNFREPIYGTVNGTFQEFISVAVMIIMLFYLCVLSSAYPLVMDRKQGTLSRSKLTGLSDNEMLVASLFYNGFIVILQILITYSLVVFVFQTQIHGSPYTYLALLFVNGISGIFLGLMFAEVLHDEMALIFIGLSLFSSSLSSCGVIWPLEASSYWLKAAIECLPYTKSIEAIRSIETRGWDIWHPKVYTAFVIQIAWIFVNCCIVGLARRARN